MTRVSEAFSYWIPRGGELPEVDFSGVSKYHYVSKRRSMGFYEGLLLVVMWYFYDGIQNRA